MFFSSKSLVLLVLLGSSFYFGFSDGRQQGNSNNSTNQNLDKREKDPKCRTNLYCDTNSRTGHKEC